MPSDTDIIIALAKKLQTQTTRDLEAENATLRRERDDARAQGIADLNRIHRHQATIRRLEEANAALRAGQGTWPDDKPDDFDCCSGDRLPRMMTAGEEFKPGQRVAYRYGNTAWHFKTMQKGDNFIGGTEVVLLADSADLEPTVVHDDDGKPWSVEVRPVKDPAPRLTVHALNTAPVGSYVTVRGEIAEKRSDGNWVGRGHFYSPAEIVSHPDSTLHRPEGGDHE